MKKAFFWLAALAAFLYVGPLVAQTGPGTFVWSNGVPTHNPQTSGAKYAVDYNTYRVYEWNAATVSWIESGDRLQRITGCAAPAYTPGNHNSRLVINGCTPTPELYYYTGSAWVKLNGGTTYTAGEGIVIDGSVIRIDTMERLSFNTAPMLSGGIGTLRWNDTDGTLDLGLKGGNVTLQLGQEQNTLVKHADNAGLANGAVVYLAGSDGANKTVRLARANSEVTSANTFGVMTEAATGGNKAFCTTFGLVRNINTAALTEGAMVYLSSTVAGAMTTTRPTAPNHAVQLGWCVRSHATLGVIFVSVQNGYELGELHDVSVTRLSDNSILKYDSLNRVWVSTTINDLIKKPANQILYGSGTDVASSQQFTFNPSTNKMAIGRTGGSPSALLHIGGLNMGTSENPAIAISRLVDNTNLSSSHGISDMSRITKTNGGVNNAYNSFDGRVVFDSTGLHDHFVSFQHAPDFSPTFTGSIDDVYGVFTTVLARGGTITNNYGYYVANPLKTGGNITNNIGLNIENLTSGNLNLAINTGVGNCRFGDTVNLLNNAALALGNAVFTAQRPLHVRRTSGIDVGVRIDQDGQNWWEWVSPASSTDFVLNDFSGEKMRIRNNRKISFKDLEGSGSAILAVDASGIFERTGLVYDAVNQRLAVAPTPFTLTETMEVKANGKTSLRIHQNGLNYWDWYLPAGSTDLVLGDVTNEKMRIKNNREISFQSLASTGTSPVIANSSGVISKEETSWTTATRPTGSFLYIGKIGYNTTTSKFEGWSGSLWVDLN